jgi:hypothetical protein
MKCSILSKIKSLRLKAGVFNILLCLCVYQQNMFFDAKFLIIILFKIRKQRDVAAPLMKRDVKP